MSLTTILKKKDQATLFMPDIEGIQKEFNKKTYLIKRLIYDRMNSLIDSLEIPNEPKWQLKKELESILNMKNTVAEKPLIQELMTIGEFSKSEQSLIDAVVKRCKEDPEFLARLGKYIV